MEYIIVRFVRKRTVFIDGKETGETGERLRVEEGTHTVNLGDPRDYTPKWRRPTVTDTTSIIPMDIEFEEA
jgi:PEGA domain